MDESTLNIVLEIAEYWLHHAPEHLRGEWQRQAYIDELLSWPPEKIAHEYADLKGEHNAM